MRHGYESWNPNAVAQFTNRLSLERKMGDVRAAMIMLCEAGDTNKQAIHEWADDKRRRVARYLHHQRPVPQ